MMLSENNMQGVYVSSLCALYGISRQGYYKSIGRENKQGLEVDRVVALVQELRKELPREGIHKLYRRLKPKFQTEGLKVGRDRLLAILQSEDMLVKPRRSYTRTTQSSHRFRVYHNLFLNKAPKYSNQVWVADITYIPGQQGYYYLHLITDAYSRKIVGYEISSSLGVESSIRALKMALKQLPVSHGLIHHSDRGFQYCSSQYTNLLKNRDIRISMAAKGNCYENALAERVNGILKQEFFLDVPQQTREMTITATHQAIKAYNEVRLHQNIAYLTPSKKHVDQNN